MLCRSKERGEAAVGSIIADVKLYTQNNCNKQDVDIEPVSIQSRIHLHLVDLSSIVEVDKFSAQFVESNSPLHGLINNAAIMLDNKSVTSEGLETVMATNLFGYVALTENLLPVLKMTGNSNDKKEPARIVNVVSAGM
mmetsp:Transcript_110163/g.237135  ORF Transcript_110163/g.237135 Transcript_110163/m.237135 type:complete len:138 (+) Transcript_110163:217-630(+)